MRRDEERRREWGAKGDKLIYKQKDKWQPRKKETMNIISKYTLRLCINIGRSVKTGAHLMLPTETSFDIIFII